MNKKQLNQTHTILYMERCGIQTSLYKPVTWMDKEQSNVKLGGSSVIYSINIDK